MRLFWFGCGLMVIALAYFIVVKATALAVAPVLPLVAVVVAFSGAWLVLVDLYRRVDRQLNRLPKPPYFIIDTVHGRCLELAVDGSYESCQELLNELAITFGAEFTNHLDAGPRPQSDKDQGYWNLTLFDQEFFLMRQGGSGICIWGPKPPADVAGFLRLAKHFQAVEFVSWQRRLLRALSRKA